LLLFFSACRYPFVFDRLKESKRVVRSQAYLKLAKFSAYLRHWSVMVPDRLPTSHLKFPTLPQLADCMLSAKQSHVHIYVP